MDLEVLTTAVGVDGFSSLEIQTITVVKFGDWSVYNGSCNKIGCFGIKVRTDAAKFANVRIARFRQVLRFGRRK